jgi:uncharacterized phage protein (TIGR02218 family)
MAFDTFETSNHEGRPIALYFFKWGNSEWKYTSADTDQWYPDDSTEGNRFRAISIRDDGMTQGGSNENDFAIHSQSDIPLVALFDDSPPTAPVWLWVRRKHADDPSFEAPVYWVGRVANIQKTENMAEADIRGVSISKLLKSGGLRLTWAKNCPHCIYDSACRVDPADHQYVRTVDEVAGPLLTLTADTVAAEGTFTGGYVEYDRDGLGTMERRGIEVQISSSQVRVLGRLPNLAPGDSVNLYPGCDQTASTCNDGFDNIDNNGGFFFMPEKSPFDGTQVFD